MRKLPCLSLLTGLVAGGGANAMTYGLVPFQDGNAAVIAQGQIGGREASRLLSALQEARAAGAMPRTLIISSPGGNLEDALQLGQIVRELGLRTVVGAIAQDSSGRRHLTPGSCHSACVMVLMAGVDRSVLPGSQVGVHSPQIVVIAGGRGYRLDDELNRRMVQRSEPVLRAYARVMGVSPALIDAAHRVPHTRIRTLSSRELSRYGLVTVGSGTPTTRKVRARRAPALSRG